MRFDKDKYEVKTATVGDGSLRYRAFENIPYVDNPVMPEFQVLNIYVPEVFYKGESINGYNLKTAPVFFPNSVGGYMPGDLEKPGYKCFGSVETPEVNALYRALEHGYVVVSAGIRGRVSKDADGKLVGKAPALIVDYKAAVRYLHKFADELPGDENKIITNGTSAGGALSSLIGATGNHKDYEKELGKIGAADASDAVFAASCYCPITNLDHADMAYEWQFDQVYNYNRMNMNMTEGGRPEFTPVSGTMSEERIRISAEEASLFPAYLNSLGLIGENGKKLTLDEKGNGSFKEYLKQVVLASANTELQERKAARYTAGKGKAEEPEKKSWLTIRDGKAADMDFSEWAKEITRMKEAPAFDDISNDSPENDEFGSPEVLRRHFTEYSNAYDGKQGLMAEKEQIKMLNPMEYIMDQTAETAKYWRIRHGERDRDTSLAISAILTLKLREAGCQVDYAAPWEQPHSGDYDLEELFAWIDKITA